MNLTTIWPYCSSDVATTNDDSIFKINIAIRSKFAIYLRSLTIFTFGQKT